MYILRSTVCRLNDAVVFFFALLLPSVSRRVASLYIYIYTVDIYSGVCKLTPRRANAYPVIFPVTLETPTNSSLPHVYPVIIFPVYLETPTQSSLPLPFFLSVEGANLHTGAVVKAKLNLIDLAGSERISKTDATGDRLRYLTKQNKTNRTLLVFCY